ncbi:MAG: prolyl oligopeptidase family serine peptidase [Cyanobacteria bacterium J06627_32]
MTQPAQATWQTPPEPIAAMLDAQRLPAVAFSPRADWIVELGRPGMPTVGELAEPKVAIAGLQINPRTWEPAKAAHYRSISLRRQQEKTARPVLSLPADARIRNLQWSHDGQYLSFTHTQAAGSAGAAGSDPGGLSLWVLNLKTAEARAITGPILNATCGGPVRWLPDNSFLCKVRTDNGPPPTPPSYPLGPIIEENLGRTAPARTYTNLLEIPHDEALLEYYLSSKLVHIAWLEQQQPKQTVITSPALFRNISPSPDGQWIKTTTIHRPFSYQVPLARFPRRTEILNRQGKSVYTVADLPLAEEIPINFDSVRDGRRSSGWRADRPATLHWVEALDGGDASQDCDYRDAIYTLPAPFSSEPKLLWKSQMRFNSLVWGTGKVALAYEALYNTRQVKTWKLSPDEATSPQLLETRNFQDAYSHPGEPVMTPGPYGWQILLLSLEGELYLNGRGASPEGIRPFLDRFNLATGKKERCWRSPADSFARVGKVLDSEAQQFIVRQESKTEPANYWLHTHSPSDEGSEEKNTPFQALTRFSDPLPWFKDIRKEIVRYTRSDGLPLSGTLYLPPNHDPKKDGPLPTLLWVYPEEHKSRETASQITRAENTFARPRRASAMFLLTQGYALLSGASMPIVGEADAEPNDSYIEQLIDSAEAAVDFLVGRGISQRGAIAIGGHSYGAFTTANLLAHTDLFSAGIARSGAYNRSLTPFGFQGEQRSYWQATDTYNRMSPFTNADKINHPLLLIHGAADNNSGTYPMQTDRLYEAMKGLGGTVRYVSLPHEEHGYRSKEAVGHVLWEMVKWLDTYVKQT